jgi:serine protease Do
MASIRETFRVRVIHVTRPYEGNRRMKSSPASAVARKLAHAVFTTCTAALTLLLASALCHGQFSLTSQLSEAERERMYGELAEEVAALQMQGNIVRKVVQLAQPTVVHIDAKKTQDGFGRKEVEEAGSGVIVKYNEKFYVLTNRHVIKHASLDNIHIKLATGQVVFPNRVWADVETDIAVMAINTPELTAARLADSSLVDIGDFVLAVGSPFGLSHSVTYGIISAKGRRDLELGVEGVRYQDFFQTDAAINPGNSGGPLLNLRGEVIGINTAIASSSGGNEGIGFTIPINIAMSVARQLIDQGSVARALLGVSLDSKYDDTQARELGLPRRIGARVNRVTPKTAAAEIGLQVGDVILVFDGVRIEDDDHLVNQVKLTPVGKRVPLIVLRDGSSVELTAELFAPED